MAKNKMHIDLTVNTKDLDRLAIGSRLYDSFDLENQFNKLHCNNKTWYITEKDINELFKLVNPNMPIKNIVVHK